MNPLKEEKITVGPLPVPSADENIYFIENEARLKNHKTIMIHLQAIEKYLDIMPKKQKQNIIPIP